MKSSIRRRLFLQVAFIIVLIGATIMILISQFLAPFYLWNEKRILTNISAEINAAINEPNFNERMHAYESKYNVIIDIYNKRGISFYTTFFSSAYQRPNTLSTYRPSQMLVINRQLNDDGTYFDERMEVSNNIKYIVFCSNNNAMGYNVDLYVQKDAIETSAQYANRFIFMITGAAVLLSVIWAFVYSKRFTKPLIQMNDVTRDMAEMDFTQKCLTATHDEIGELGHSINHLSDTLAVALHDLQEKNAQLEKDIERERSLEKMRREFIANVSHELKTPIAIIRGYAEGLQINVREDPARCLDYADVIVDEANNMNTMVLDLLELSKYETGHATLNREIFNISDFVCKILEKNTIRLDESGILSYNRVGSGLYGDGDVGKLEQILNNYISNAVSHCKDPKRIEIDCRDVGDAYRLSVFNTGDRIPVSEMENLWVSFYRSDKAHNRDQGRFGLGLSIVRAIQETHGLGYGVDNRENGVSFWFDIKKADLSEP